MKYSVKAEFIYNWTFEDVDRLIVTDHDIKSLSEGWSTPVEELMKQVEPVDE